MPYKYVTKVRGVSYVPGAGLLIIMTPNSAIQDRYTLFGGTIDNSKDFDLDYRVEKLNEFALNEARVSLSRVDTKPIAVLHYKINTEEKGFDKVIVKSIYHFVEFSTLFSPLERISPNGTKYIYLDDFSQRSLQIYNLGITKSTRVFVYSKEFEKLKSDMGRLSKFEMCT